MNTFPQHYKEDVKKQLEKQLDLHESMKKAWQAVTRNYKKNGEPFAKLAQNFNGVSVYDSPYSLAAGVKRITVTTQTAKNGYQSEEIENKELVKYTDLNPDESRIIKESFLEAYFFLNPDEIERRIKERIEYHERRAKELKKAIKENDRDNAKMEKLLDYIGKELAKMNPDAARIYKDKLIRNYY